MPTKVLTLILLTLSLASAGGAPARALQAGRGRAPVTGEYRDASEMGSLTFNVERAGRRGKYRLWVGSMGTSSMNYRDAWAAGLRLDEKTGALSFAYVYDTGERCSFRGTVKGGTIRGRLACTESGRRTVERVTLKRFR